MSAMRIVDDYPIAERGPKLAELAELFEGFFAKDERPSPEWVKMLAALAEQQEASGGSRGPGRGH